jgi:hypothetical protein
MTDNPLIGVQVERHQIMNLGALDAPVLQTCGW